MNGKDGLSTRRTASVAAPFFAITYITSAGPTLSFGERAIVPVMLPADLAPGAGSPIGG